MRRSPALAVALLALSCRSAPPPAPEPPRSPTPPLASAAPAAVEAAAPAPPRACSEVLRPLAPLADVGAAALPAVAEDSAPAVRRVCEAAARATRQRVAGARERPRGDDPGPFGRCFAAGRGAWLLELEDYRGAFAADCHDGPRRWGFDARYRAAYVSAEGETTREGGEARAAFVHACANERAEVALTHDFDGDGVAELLLVSTAANTASTDVRGALLTAHGGAIAPYLAAGSALADGLRVADVDGDHRPDFVVPGPYVAASDPNAPEPADARGVSVVLHARPDGSFSRDDDVARAWVTRQCVGLPPPTNGASVTAFVGCARFQGASAAQAEAALRAAQSSLAADERPSDEELVAMRAMIRADPPFTVAPCAP